MITGIVAGLPSTPTVPDLVAEYLNADEYTHDWSNLTGWTATSVQVSGNKLFGVSGGNPAGAGRAFSIQAGFIGRITAEIVEVASGAGYRFVGLNFGGASNGVLASLPNFAGIGMGTTSRTAAAWVGANFTGVTTGQVVLGNASAIGTFRVTVTVTEDVISMVLRRQDGAEEWSHVIARSAAPNGGNVTDLVIWNGSSAGTSGSYVKAVGVKASLTPFRTKSNAAGEIEGTAGQVVRLNPSDPWRVHLPEVGDGTTPAPVVVFMHQASTGDANSVWDEARMLPVTQALEAAGYVLVSADDGGDRWGNSTSLANYAALVEWIKERYYCGPILLLGPSMGGAPMFNTIARGTIPGVVGAAGICPVCDLDNMYANAAFTASLRTAYGATDDAGFVANSDGWSPNDNLGEAFAGVRFRFYAGAPGSDTVVPREQHIDMLQAVIAPHVPEAEIVTAGSGHLQIAQYQPTDLLAFYARCLAATPVIPEDFVFPLTYDELDATHAVSLERSGGAGPHVTPDGFEGDGYEARYRTTTLPSWLTPVDARLTLHASIRVLQPRALGNARDSIVFIGANTSGAQPRLELAVVQDVTTSSRCMVALRAFTTAAQQLHLGRPTWQYQLRFPQLSVGGYTVRPQALMFVDATHLLVVGHYEDTSSGAFVVDLTTGLVDGQFTFGSSYRHVSALAKRTNGDIWVCDYDTGKLVRLDLTASLSSGTAVLLDVFDTSVLNKVSGIEFVTVSGTEYALVSEYATSGTPYLYVIPASILGTATFAITQRHKRFQLGIRIQGQAMKDGKLWVTCNTAQGTSNNWGWLQRYDIVTAITSGADGATLASEQDREAPSRYPEDLKFHPVTGHAWTLTEGASSVGDIDGFLGIWSSPLDGQPQFNHYTAEYDGAGIVTVKVNGQLFDQRSWVITQAADAVSVGGLPQASAGFSSGFSMANVKNLLISNNALDSAEYAAVVSGSYEANSLTAYELALTNPGAEAGNTTGWTAEIGAMNVRSVNPAPYAGSFYFNGGSAVQSVSRQRLDLVAQGVPSAKLDLGTAWAKIRWKQAAWDNNDPGGMGVRTLTSADATIATSYSALAFTPFGPGAAPGGPWFPRCWPVLMAGTTRKVDALYNASGRTGGTNNDHYVDEISVTVYHP